MGKSSKIPRKSAAARSFLERLGHLLILLLLLSSCTSVSTYETLMPGQVLALNCSLVSKRVMLDVSIVVDVDAATADLRERSSRAGTFVVWENLQVEAQENRFLVLRSTVSDLLNISDQHRVNFPNLSYERVRTIVMGNLAPVTTRDKGKCWPI